MRLAGPQQIGSRLLSRYVHCFNSAKRLSSLIVCTQLLGELQSQPRFFEFIAGNAIMNLMVRLEAGACSSNLQHYLPRGLSKFCAQHS
jgi:hypothetical protein